MTAGSGLRLTLSGGDLPPEELAAITRELADDLVHAGADAKLAPRDARPGERSFAIELFTIALTVLEHTSGHLVADVIKKHLLRAKDGQIKIVDPEGRLLAAFNNSSIEIGKLAALIKDHLPTAR